MAFSINGRIYHSSLGLALIVLGPAGRRQLRQCLGSHDIFTIKSSASLGTLFFHKYLGNDILLDIYNTRLKAPFRVLFFSLGYRTNRQSHTHKALIQKRK